MGISLISSSRDGNQIPKVENYSLYLSFIVWSILSSVWLYVMLSVITPNVIEIWEILVLVIMHPIFLVIGILIEKINAKTHESPYFANQSVNFSEISSNYSNKSTIEGYFLSRKSI